MRNREEGGFKVFDWIPFWAENSEALRLRPVNFELLF